MNTYRNIKIKLKDGQIVEFGEGSKSESDGFYIFTMSNETFVTSKAEVVWILVSH